MLHVMLHTISFLTECFTYELLFQVATQPVQQQGTVVTTTQPPDYLCLAILAVICFCPLGMPAIIYASDVRPVFIC
jgi:hypothetical protein